MVGKVGAESSPGEDPDEGAGEGTGNAGEHNYVALLRGINVGGRNKISMADLRATFEGHGYRSVSTYIQSGNVLFATDATPQGAVASLAADVEQMLDERLRLPVVVVVRSHEDLRRAVEEAPPGFGAAPETYHSDVVFLKEPLTSEEALRVVRLREGVDSAWAGGGLLYFRRLSARRTQSRLSALMGTPEYKSMTIRNWATTTRLLALLDARHP